MTNNPTSNNYGIDISGTTANRLRITNAPIGHLFYDTDKNKAYVWTGAQWSFTAAGYTEDEESSSSSSPSEGDVPIAEWISFWLEHPIVLYTDMESPPGIWMRPAIAWGGHLNPLNAYTLGVKVTEQIEDEGHPGIYSEGDTVTFVPWPHQFNTRTSPGFLVAIAGIDGGLPTPRDWYDVTYELRKDNVIIDESTVEPCFMMTRPSISFYTVNFNPKAIYNDNAIPELHFQFWCLTTGDENTVRISISTPDGSTSSDDYNVTIADVNHWEYFWWIRGINNIINTLPRSSEYAVILSLINGSGQIVASSNAQLFTLSPIT